MLDFVPQESLKYVGVALGVLVLIVLFFAWRLLRRLAGRKGRESDTQSSLPINVRSLAAGGPPADGPTLEFYHVPVRLAVVVLAPVGRDGRLPSDAQMPEVIEGIQPGLMRVLQSHRPTFHRWPAQLSVQGFTHAFFNNAALPGDRGRGTPWCSAAGKIELAEGNYLAGIICCAATPNSLSEVAVKHAAAWPDVIRVKA